MTEYQRSTKSFLIWKKMSYNGMTSFPIVLKIVCGFYTVQNGILCPISKFFWWMPDFLQQWFYFSPISEDAFCTSICSRQYGAYQALINGSFPLRDLIGNIHLCRPAWVNNYSVICGCVISPALVANSHFLSDQN